MSDDLTNRGPADDSRVNIHERWELNYWCKKWAITETVLKQAVKEAGVIVKNVEKWLKDNGHLS